MGWKETIIGVASFMVLFVTGVFPSQTEAFANSIIPDAGYYIVRVVFAFAAICVVGVIIHSLYVSRKRKTPKPNYGKIMMQRLKRFQNEASLGRLRDRMEYVYGPLHSAVVSMREGQGVLPEGYTVGTPLNAWSKYPEIMQRVIDIFSNYPNLIENERVWKGWTQKEHELREGKFWLGGEVYEWFDAIEEEYNRIDLELKPTPVDRQYEIATLRFRIWSTTDWVEIGLVDSRHVTVRSYDLSKGSVKSVDEPNGSHLRIDLPAAEFSVTATFEVYSGPLFVFTRKGDHGTLKVDIFNKNDEKISEIPEYGKTDKKYNYQEQPGFEFGEWD